MSYDKIFRERLQNLYLKDTMYYQPPFNLIVCLRNRMVVFWLKFTLLGWFSLNDVQLYC